MSDERAGAFALERRRHVPGSPWTYAALDARQREVAERVRAGGEGALLLSEVAPVITLGRRTPASDLLLSEAALSARGISVLRTDRGGLATYHGPGQWVAFAVDRLDRLTGDPRGVRRAVDGLLVAALETARDWVPFAQIRVGAELGIWSSRGKLASVGVHVDRRVLLHGVALNVHRCPESFVGLRPCGLDAAVDFLTQDPAEFERAGDRLASALEVRFWPSARAFGRLTPPRTEAITGPLRTIGA